MEWEEGRVGRRSSGREDEELGLGNAWSLAVFSLFLEYRFFRLQFMSRLLPFGSVTPLVVEAPGDEVSVLVRRHALHTQIMKNQRLY